MPMEYGPLRLEVLADLNGYSDLYGILRPGELPEDHHHGFIYQSPGWMATWQETIGKEKQIRPLLLVVYAGEKPVLLLPLGLRQRFGLTIAEFLGQSDSNQNTGVWDKQFLLQEDPHSLSRALASLLRGPLKQAGVDLMSLGNVPAHFNGLRIPLPFSSLVPSVNPILLGGLSRDFDALYAQAFGKNSRRTLQRKEKSLVKAGDFKVFQAQTEAEIEAGLADFFEQRQVRAELTGIPNAFNSEAGKSFIRRLCQITVDGNQATSEDPVMSVWLLQAGGKTRATYLCAHDQRIVVAYTNSIAHDELTAKSPGVILLKEMLHQICDAGSHDVLDFGLGDERYKYGWSEPFPLSDLYLPTTFKGRIGLTGLLAYSRLKAFVRNTPALWAFYRKLRSWMARSA